MNKNKGITLVALVITIIILLILAGITISQLTGSGLFEKAQLAEQKSKEAQELENSILSDYTNKIDSYVSNTTREPENEKEMKFYKGNYGFNVTHGEMAFNSYGLKGITMDYMPDGWTWYVAECEKVEKATLGDEFEISAQIYFNNCTTAHMGAIKVKLEENGEEKVHLNVGDCWGNESGVQMYGTIYNSIIADNQNLSRNNGSGRYAIIGDGEKVYFYWGETLLGSIDYTENISYDKIVIQFLKYPGYNVQPMYLESLYVGEPLYYKSMINK